MTHQATETLTDAEAWRAEQASPKTPREAGEKLARWSRAYAETVGISYEDAWRTLTRLPVMTP